MYKIYVLSSKESQLPCADIRYCFAKIEYNDIVEYYDVYHKTTDSIFKRRF